jgi:PBP1b-binding outer membrane lipoprotein LpoB
MSARHIFCAILCLALVLGSCSTGKDESEKTESAPHTPQPN